MYDYDYEYLEARDDARAEAAEAAEEEKRERAFSSAYKEVMRDARQRKTIELEQQGLTPEQVGVKLEEMDEDGILEELARDIFEGLIDSYIDPCGCHDPCCPCSGYKIGVP